MTQPTRAEQTQGDESEENFVIDDAAAPQLAAIQQDYEEARASIIDPTRAPLNWVHDPADPYPETEAIGLDAVPPPIPDDAHAPTEDLPATTSTGTTDFLGLRRWWRAFWTP
jgi:hypothetical protein